MPQVNFTPKSWEQKRAESLKHAMDMFGIVKDRNYHVGPDPQFDYLKRADNYTHQANKIRQQAQITRANNKNIAISQAPIRGLSGKSADIITHNIQGGKRNPAQIRKDLLKLIGTGAGIIGLQETGGKKRTQRVRRILKNQGYGVHGKSNTPIAFDKDQYRRIGKGAPIISPDTFVGSRGAGPSTLKQKYANYLILKQLGGGPRRSVTNVHLAPSRQLAVRRRLSDQQIANVIALQKQIAKQYPKIQRNVIGDFNVGKKSPLKGFNRIGIKTPQSPYKTHRVGTPDWLLGGARNLETIATGSDHHALAGQFKDGPSGRSTISGGGSFEAFVNAISGKESGGNYGAVNKHSGALGKYQIMPANIPSWSQAALGRQISAQEFLRSPKLQEQIARAKLQEYYQKYGPAGAASAWYSGDPNKVNSKAAQGQYPSIHAYVQAILSAIGRR